MTVELSSEVALLRECQDRALSREGIPMLLALVSECDDLPAAVDPAVRSQGAHLAAAMDDWRAALVPTSRDDDMGAVITVLQVAAYADFGRDGTSL